jgi:hypothetical protein
VIHLIQKWLQAGVFTRRIRQFPNSSDPTFADYSRLAASGACAQVSMCLVVCKPRVAAQLMNPF